MKMQHPTRQELSVESFVALDIETTGLEPERDEIIEIGMVRVNQGEPGQRYHQLFHPSVPIPRFITQITGIRQEDCENQPALEDKLEEIADFLGTDWIVAHNAAFDVAFIRKAWERAQSGSLDISWERILDTLELSRILLPWLPNHRLNTVVKHLSVPQESQHRALADAETTAQIFEELLHLALGLDSRVVSMIHRICDGASDGLRLFFERLYRFMEKHKTAGKKPKPRGPANILGSPNPREPSESVEKIEPGEIEGFFGRRGTLAAMLPGYEMRTPQMDMAQVVARAFNQEAFLVGEAGTGVGKSLAYLVPSVLWAIKNNGRVIVSTQTKTLQDQLFSKELPLLFDTLDEPFLATLLKGRANYICLRRWHHLLEHLEERMTLTQRRKLLPLTVWMSETRTGDIEENAGFRQMHNKQIWSELCSEGRACRGYECEFEADCFYQRTRKASRASHIVLVNHSLLFSDAAAGFTVLGNYDSLVVDEAHQIEKVASDCLARTLHRWLFWDLCQRMIQPDAQNKGILITLQNALQHSRGDTSGTAELLRLLESLAACTQELSQAAFQLFQAIDTEISHQPSTDAPFRKQRLRGASDFFGPVSEETDALINCLQSFSSELSQVNSRFYESGIDGHTEEVGRELEAIADQSARLEELLAHFIREEYEDDVVWYETREVKHQTEVILYSVPLDIGKLLATVLYPRLARCVLTSATLSIAENFDYIRGRLGLDDIDDDRVMTRLFGSPFDFAEQALLLVPTFLSNPKESAFSGDVSALLNVILSADAPGTMVLFTSHKLLQDVYRTIQPVCDERGIRLLAQGIDGSRTTLLNIFREDKKSVLLGTNSFWEGVDVPGAALELLIITKIPFDVPTEPLVQARMEQAQARTGNGFMNYTVPEAVVRFRQGFGRLIRSGEDRGAVLILDHRLVETQYGRIFLESLPVRPSICANHEALLTSLNQWFGAQKQPVEA